MQWESREAGKSDTNVIKTSTFAAEIPPKDPMKSTEQEKKRIKSGSVYRRLSDAAEMALKTYLN